MKLEEAQQARRNRKYKKAIELYMQAIHEDPNNALAHSGLGLTYIYLNQNDKALAMANKALQFDVNQPLAYITLASIYHAKGEMEQFKVEVEKAFALDPFFYEVGCTYANMLVSEKKFDEVLPVFEKIIESNPKKVCPHYLLGYINFQKNRFDIALKEFVKAFLVQPSLTIIIAISRTIINFYKPWSNIVFGIFFTLWYFSIFFYKVGALTVGVFSLLLIFLGANQKRMQGEKGWAIFYLITFFVLAYVFYYLYQNATL